MTRISSSNNNDAADDALDYFVPRNQPKKLGTITELQNAVGEKTQKNESSPLKILFTNIRPPITALSFAFGLSVNAVIPTNPYLLIYVVLTGTITALDFLRVMREAENPQEMRQKGIIVVERKPPTEKQRYNFLKLQSELSEISQEEKTR